MRVKFGIPAGIVVLCLWWFVAGLIPDTIATGRLTVGDCYAEPNRRHYDKVTRQDCDRLHEYEVLAAVDVRDGVPWPGASEIGASYARRSCDDAVDALTLDEDHLTNDAAFGYLFAQEWAWDNGDRTVVCFVTTNVGFPGRVLVSD